MQLWRQRTGWNRGGIWQPLPDSIEEQGGSYKPHWCQRDPHISGGRIYQPPGNQGYRYVRSQKDNCADPGGNLKPQKKTSIPDKQRHHLKPETRSQIVPKLVDHPIIMDQWVHTPRCIELIKKSEGHMEKSAYLNIMKGIMQALMVVVWRLGSNKETNRINSLCKINNTKS